jgi:hypothetical protein
MNTKDTVRGVSIPAPSPVELRYLPSFWDGESLYGWSSRLHALRGGKARVTGRILFGREHACRQYDLPSGLGRLAWATGNQLGSTESLLRERTVLAAYWPFASQTTRQAVLDAAKDASGLSITMALGLAASRLGAEHPLKYCEHCHREQLASTGYSTWLVRHQMPGAWWCAAHGCTLHQVTQHRAVWRKPGRDCVQLGAPIDAPEQQALQTMALLSQAIASADQINEPALAAAAIHRLRQIGVATSAARLNTKKVAEWLDAAPIMRWMRRQADLLKVPGNNWAVHLLRSRARGHPLKWQILWTCAWQSAPPEVATQAFIDASENKLMLPIDAQETFWQGEPSGAVRFSLPASVQAAFDKHTTMRAVADEMVVTIGAVRQWLTDYPEVAASWLARVRQEQLRRAVTTIENCLKEQPTITRSQILRVCHTEFSWLSSNASAVKRSLLDRVPSDRGPQGELF